DGTLRLWEARLGVPLSDPLRTDDQVWGARFTKPNHWVITQSGLLWEITPAPLPVAPWLPNLAEAISGQRLEHGNFLPVPARAFLNLKKHLESAPETNSYVRWAKWYLADPHSRTISPSAHLQVPDYVKQQIVVNTLVSLREAIRVCPTNRVARLKLDQRLLEQQ